MPHSKPLECKQERRGGEPARRIAGQEQNEQLAAAEQRIVRSEQLLTRLSMLSEDRRSFGLCDVPTELLMGKISQKLNDWTIHRNKMFPVSSEERQNSGTG
jgi:hypothetical protein